MKKIHTVSILIAGLLILITSCNKQKTYAEYLKDETKAIDLFIAKNNLVILKEFPADTSFNSNEFYKDPSTGVYFNIIDRGEEDRKIQLGQEVYVRFSGLSYFKSDDTTFYSNLDPNTSPFPQTLIYRGPVTVSTRSLYSSSVPGWIVPLYFVGHTGRAKLIVPFNMGSSYEQSNYEPTYYDNVQYRFE